MLLARFSAPIAKLHNVSRYHVVGILFALCVVFPVVSRGQKSLPELTPQEMETLIPELKPIFDLQCASKPDWKKMYRVGEALAAQYPASSTPALFAKYYATTAKFAAEFPNLSSLAGREVSLAAASSQVRRTLMSLLDTIKKSYPAGCGWLIAQLREKIAYEIATCDFALGEYDKAIGGFVGVIRRNPTCKPLVGLAFKFMGMSYAAKGEAENGIAQIKGLGENYPVPSIVRALAYYECGNLEVYAGKNKEMQLKFYNEAIRSTTDEQLIEMVNLSISMVEQQDGR